MGFNGRRSALASIMPLLGEPCEPDGVNTVMRLLEIYSPQDLANHADMYVDQADHGDNVDLYNWVFVENMPLALLVTSPDVHGRVHGLKEWVDWFKTENDTSQEEMGERSWDYLKNEAIEEPIVITMDDQNGKSWDIWDGWHRSGALLTTGQKTIPAIIGYYKGEG